MTYKDKASVFATPYQLRFATKMLLVNVLDICYTISKGFRKEDAVDATRRYETKRLCFMTSTPGDTAPTNKICRRA